MSFLILYIIFHFFHPYVSFFFILLFFLHPTRIPIFLHPLLFFLYFPLDSRTSLSLSFSNSLFIYFFFFFFFYLILEHSLALFVIRNGERGRERKNKWVRWLRSTAPSAPLSVPHLPLHRRRVSSSPTQPRWARWFVSFFLFSYCYDLTNFKIMFLSLYFDYAWV